MKATRGDRRYCCLSQHGYHRHSSTIKSMDVICHTDEILCCSVPHFLVYKMELMLTILRVHSLG